MATGKDVARFARFVANGMGVGSALYLVAGLCLVALLTGSCSRVPYSLPPESPYYAALIESGRPEADRERDERRQPAHVLTLAEIRPGMAVADLMAGGGWYTELLSRVVGPSGSVVAQNSRISNERYGPSLRERIASSGLTNVELLVGDLDEVELPRRLDAIFLVQFYHDTIWMGFDRAEMNRRIFEALVPGGVFVVIDHSAEIGSQERDVQILHRVDESLVRREVLAAGFDLAAESPALRNERDDRDGNVFGFTIRGRSDRFLLVFRKPSASTGPVRIGRVDP